MLMDISLDTANVTSNVPRDDITTPFFLKKKDYLEMKPNS